MFSDAAVEVMIVVRDRHLDEIRCAFLKTDNKNEGGSIIDKRAKSRIPMAKKKDPPIL